MVVKRDPNRGVFGQRHGAEVVTQVMGGRGGFSGAGFRGAASASPKQGGLMGSKTSGQAKASQPGSNLAKNFRAGGNFKTAKGKKNWFGF